MMKAIRQEPFLDFENLELSRVRSIENQVLRFGLKMRDFFRKGPTEIVRTTQRSLGSATAAATRGAPPPPPLPKRDLDVRPLSVVEISGYYKVTGVTEATFYSITDWPLEPIGKGWILEGATGLRGELFVATTRNERGSDFSWSFTFQANMDQSVGEGPVYVTSASLYPPGRMSMKRSAPIYGYYEIIKHVPKFYFSAPPITGTKEGWIIDGLPTLRGPQVLTEFDVDVPEKRINANSSDYYQVLVTSATLRAIDGSIPEDAGPVTVKGFPVLIHEPDPKIEYTPGRFVQKPKTTTAIRAPENIKIGNPPDLRDLNDTGLFPEPPLKTDESRGRGFSQGSILSLAATGPQDEYLLSKDFRDSQWNPEFKQYSNFVMFQRVIPLPVPNPYYQGQVYQVEIKPTEMGHLLSNMYLKVTLPALPGGAIYTPEGGRALIKQVDFLINETTIETIYDDWYIIRDQVLLDADEQKALQIALAAPSTGGDVVIPLDLFFCRRHSHANKGRERLRRPYFPMCAMWNQRLYIRFTFQPSTWWSNAASTIDFTAPKLITEEILLSEEEKVYYQTTPLKYIVNHVTREAGLTFNTTNPSIQLSANYPIQMLTWFFRKKTYEDPSNYRYADSRYIYGYTTQYILTGINLNFPSGTSKFVDVIDSAKITLNNVDILSTFQGSLYYSFKQPMEHGLSIPSKNIYTYSFGLNPKEYNQGGYLNFAKLSSQITTLSIAFNPSYSTQISTGYTLYIFYYGYTLLEFQNGYASTPFV